MGPKSRDELNRYLIIAGATRSGSTSLFRYLSDHPEVCPASKKEPRFFIDPDYPIHADFVLEDGLEHYLNYFHECGGAIRLEASPQYLFSPKAAKRIRNSLSRVKLIFLIRDPIEWLVSSFRFAKQIGRLPGDIEITDWVKQQLVLAEESVLAQEHHYRALVNGRFETHLDRYRAVFDSDEILVLPFEFLTEHPNILLEEICAWLDINEEFYSSYDFKTHNKSGRIRNRSIHALYRSLKRGASHQLHGLPILWKVLRWLFRLLQPIYFNLNTAAAKRIEIGADLKPTLQEYFVAEYELRHRILNEMTGKISSRRH